MRKLLCCILSVFLASCATLDELPVYSADGWDTTKLEVIEDAGGHLGVVLVPSKRQYGAIHIVWWDEIKPETPTRTARAGQASRFQFGCLRKVQGVRRGSVIAHEIGHAFHLKHSPHNGDLMFIRVGRTPSSFRERETFLRHLRRFITWCPNST